jgi:hypothetical protein
MSAVSLQNTIEHRELPLASPHPLNTQAVLAIGLLLWQDARVRAQENHTVPAATVLLSGLLDECRCLCFSLRLSLLTQDSPPYAAVLTGRSSSRLATPATAAC